MVTAIAYSLHHLYYVYLDDDGRDDYLFIITTIVIVVPSFIAFPYHQYNQFIIVISKEIYHCLYGIPLQIILKVFEILIHFSFMQLDIIATDVIEDVTIVIVIVLNYLEIFYCTELSYYLNCNGSVCYHYGYLHY